MKKQLVVSFLIMNLAFMSTGGHSADLRSLIEFKEKGTIDWTAGLVEATGVGIPATYSYNGKAQNNQQEIYSEAINKAQHNLLETIVSLRIDSQNRVIDVVENYPSIMTQLRDMAHKASEVEKQRKYRYDGTVEVWSQMNLNGGFFQLILPREIRQIESIQQFLSRKNPSKLQTRSRLSDIFSGIVLDARGIQAVPVLAPKILDENLEEVFGPAFVSREFAVQHGVVRYITDIWQAKFHRRVSDNPLIIKALKVLWPGRCDFIISNADAAKLRSASEHLAFLKQCRVIIVMDPM